MVIFFREAFEAGTALGVVYKSSAELPFDWLKVISSII